MQVRNGSEPLWLRPVRGGSFRGQRSPRLGSAALLGGVAAKLTLGGIPDLREGAVLSGEEIAHLRPPTTVDNMEGLSIGREGRRTIVWIASDDNFSALQRTLLLKFALE